MRVKTIAYPEKVTLPEGSIVQLIHPLSVTTLAKERKELARYAGECDIVPGNYYFMPLDGAEYSTSSPYFRYVCL